MLIQVPTSQQTLNAQVKYPYGYFINMELWPKQEVPLGDDDIILEVGMMRRKRDCIIRKKQLYRGPGPDNWLWAIFPGQTFNGASVPRLFHRIIAPYSPTIRGASSFHDVYCTTKIRSQKQTHKMFWNIVRLDGMNCILAFICWLFVRCWCRIRYITWR